jgi:hypothetical protein
LVKAQVAAASALAAAVVVVDAAAAVVVARVVVAVAVVAATHATRLRDLVAAVATAAAVVVVKPQPAQPLASNSRVLRARTNLRGRAPKRVATVGLRRLVRHHLSAENARRCAAKIIS